MTTEAHAEGMEEMQEKSLACDLPLCL